MKRVTVLKDSTPIRHPREPVRVDRVPPPPTGYYVYHENVAPESSTSSWGCIWIMLIVILLVFFGLFFIIWYVPPPGSARIPANTPMAHVSNSGMSIPGLGKRGNFKVCMTT